MVVISVPANQRYVEPLLFSMSHHLLVLMDCSGLSQTCLARLNLRSCLSPQTQLKVFQACKCWNAVWNSGFSLNIYLTLYVSANCRDIDFTYLHVAISDFFWLNEFLLWQCCPGLVGLGLRIKILLGLVSVRKRSRLGLQCSVATGTAGKSANL